MNTRNLKIVVALAVVAAVVVIVQAGSLEPPGPVAPTMLPLDQVEPRTPLSNASFTIPSSGSYYLTEDITAAVATGISINASDVTLDLSGFTVRGADTEGVAGISVSSANNVLIYNGTVRGFETGVSLDGGTDVTLNDLSLIGNTGTGLQIFSSEVTINRATITDNGASGVTVAADVFRQVSISDSKIAGNSGNGIIADSVFLGVRDTRVHMNGVRGIDVSMADAQLQGNTVDLNGSDGIATGLSSGLIVGNRSFNNGLTFGGFGVLVTDGDANQLIAQNIASGNSSGNFSLDPLVAAATVSAIPGSPGDWDNIAPAP